MNLIMRHTGFARNFEKVFGFSLPQMDTVNAVMEKLDEKVLETLKATLVGELIERKVFHKFKLFGQLAHVVIDATRTHRFDHQHCDLGH